MSTLTVYAYMPILGVSIHWFTVAALGDGEPVKTIPWHYLPAVQWENTHIYIVEHDYGLTNIICCLICGLVNFGHM
jgi:hypothetical protein